VKNFWTRFVNETDGQDLIEYALLAATIALGTIAGMKVIRDAVNSEFSTIGASLTSGT
jgi:Flp pilus assembly pilin Flp